MLFKNVVVASAVRTPIGKFSGAFQDLTAVNLGAVAVSQSIARSGAQPADVDELFMGCVLGAGLGQNSARQTAIEAGVPVSVPATTVNCVCGSGMKAVALAAALVESRQADLVVAGGMESMTQAPHLLPAMRKGCRLGDSRIVDSLVKDGLSDAYSGLHMGIFADRLAETLAIAREDQDVYAVRSHARAIAAAEESRFKTEIAEVPVPRLRKGGDGIVSVDEGPRADTSLDRLASLSPVFGSAGTVTAGNASQLSDGAAALVITRPDVARDRDLTPIARIQGFAERACEPSDFLMAPIGAIDRLVGEVAVSVDAFDLFEFNEAFAVQAVALVHHFGLDFSRVNVNGGAVSLGHPIGCSGARILTTLIHALSQRGAARGLASLCVGGGVGMAMSVEVI